MDYFFRTVSHTKTLSKWKDAVNEPGPPTTWEHAKQMYRKSALIHHPDKGGNSEIFNKLNDAYEALQECEDAGNIVETLQIWKVIWDVHPKPIPSSTFFSFAPTPKLSKGELHAKLTEFDQMASESQRSGKAFTILSNISQRFSDPRARISQFFVWRALLNNRHDTSHSRQAKIMQDLCSTLDLAVTLVHILMQHPCLRDTSHDSLMCDDQWDRTLLRLFSDLLYRNS